MIKKKAKKKAGKKAAKKATKKAGKANRRTRSKKETNPAEVREKISKLVAADATEMAKAAIVGGKSGQLATVKYLFEMANIYPIPKNVTEAGEEEEDCLAKMLLDRLKPPVKEPMHAEEGTGDAAAEKIESGGEVSAAEGSDVVNPDIP